jgi:hypothetical protein
MPFRNSRSRFYKLAKAQEKRLKSQNFKNTFFETPREAACRASQSHHGEQARKDGEFDLLLQLFKLYVDIIG